MTQNRISSAGGLVTAVAVVTLFVAAAAVPAMDGYAHFSLLKDRLLADGFDRNTIERLYRQPAVSFADVLAGSYFRHREGRLNYGQFTSKSAIQKAKSYMDAHADALERARKTYGVDPSVITAIMLVETRLGTYVGTSPVLSVLSTIAALENHVNRDILWRNQLNRYKLSRKKYDRKALQKARWAYRELKAFLTYTQRDNIDPAAVVGSYAGAVGFAQFLPSNILALGEDGNGDGTVDLFTHADAIASIANYLKHAGWRPGIDRKTAYKAVYSYNHSRYYVNTVLKISDLLKG